MRLRIFIGAMLAAVLFYGAASAQSSPIDKGTLSFSGGFPLVLTNDDYYGGNSGRLSLLLSPSLTFFAFNGVALGGDIRYLFTEYDRELGFGLRSAYHFHFNRKFDAYDHREIIKGSLYPYVGTGLYYSTSTHFSGRHDPSVDIALYSGVDYMLTNRVALYVQVEYDRRINEFEEARFFPNGPNDYSLTENHGSLIRLFTGFTFFLYDEANVTP